MSSVALWYQTEPHKPWPPLPPGSERLPFHEQALVVGWRAVAEAKHSPAPLEVQEVGGVTDNKQLWFRPTDANAWVEVSFTVDTNMNAQLWLKLLHSWDYGIYRVKIDGKELATLDLLNANAEPKTHKLGFLALAAGPHTLRFECVGKADKSKGYYFGFDALTARIPVYFRTASKDLRDLQVHPK
jgi:D-arabinan exo alpha-(1,3)/(1,5)-arabinofuranosidase (non-reducing end)